MLVVGILLLVPLAWLAFQSVRSDGGFTLAHYARFIDDEAYWRSFLQTFRIAFLVTVVCVLLGYPVAYLASQMPKRWSVIVLALVILPFWTSVLVRAYAWMILLQRTGLINSMLMSTGLTSDPLPLVNNEFGVVMATTHILLPFIVLPLYATMQKIPPELSMAGASLGAAPPEVFMRIFLPLSLPGLIAGMVLVFVLTLGFYITPELLGGGRTYMVSMLVSLNINVYNEWGAASSISVVLVACVFIIFRLISFIVPFERIMGTR
ncbi:ABC transporter permease [Agrobacterium sp. CR_3]|uniref:ABC transporter permease n=1 Tax=Agrobacterium sp. CR_3 TaxID=3055791 RepID=UPI0035BF34FE